MWLAKKGLKNYLNDMGKNRINIYNNYLKNNTLDEGVTFVKDLR